MTNKLSQHKRIKDKVLYKFSHNSKEKYHKLIINRNKKNGIT